MFSDLSEKQLKELKKEVLNYKTYFRDTINVPGEIQFGCEVEFNTNENRNFYKSYVDNIYKVIYDLSAMDIVEIVSPIMHNTKEDWESMRNLLIDIKSAGGAVISSTSGGHIHYDHSIIKDDNILSFLKLWNLMESTIYDFSAGEFEKLRPNAQVYARKLVGLDKNIELIESGKRQLKTLKKYDKIYGLNLANHFSNIMLFRSSKDTYEVRVPNGSLNINTWQNNVEFFANLFYFANNLNNKDFINDLYSENKYLNKYKKRLLVADMLYNDEESKIRFLNQFEQKETFQKNAFK